MNENEKMNEFGAECSMMANVPFYLFIIIILPNMSDFRVLISMAAEFLCLFSLAVFDMVVAQFTIFLYFIRYGKTHTHHTTHNAQKEHQGPEITMYLTKNGNKRVKNESSGNTAAAAAAYNAGVHCCIIIVRFEMKYILALSSLWIG